MSTCVRACLRACVHVCACVRACVHALWDGPRKRKARKRLPTGAHRGATSRVHKEMGAHHASDGDAKMGEAASTNQSLWSVAKRRSAAAPTEHERHQRWPSWQPT